MTCRLSVRGRARALFLGLAGTLALVPVPAAHAINLNSRDVTVTVPGSDHGDVVWPGDSFNILAAVENSEAGTTLTGVQGLFSTPNSDVTVNTGSATYPDLPFGSPQTGDTPFSATLAPAAECGESLPFNVHYTTANAGSQTVAYSVPTGTTAPASAHDSLDVPKQIQDVSSTDSTFAVTSAGRVKHLHVRLGELDHTYDGDLKIELIAPSGRKVLLADGVGGSGQNFIDTEFDDEAANPIGSGTAPFTGSFKPAQPLSTLDGEQIQGTWTLRVTDQIAGNSGTVKAWGVDIAQAVCNSRPIASFTATPNPVSPGGTVHFDASGSVDPVGTITKYEWDLDGNGTYETDTGATPTVDQAYPTRGGYDIGLRVSDSKGDTATTMVPLAVADPPTARFTWTPSTPQTGVPVSFDAGGSTDPAGAGHIVRYEWDFDGDGVFEATSGSDPTISHTFNRSGSDTVRLRIRNDAGATDIVSHTVTLGNAGPTAALTGPHPAVVGQPAVFDGSGSTDPDGTVVDYSWDLDGDGTYETDTGPVDHAQTTYASPGPRTVGLRVTDDGGATATTTVAVDVTRAPTATFTVNPNPVAPNRNVTFNASGSSDPDGQGIAKYEWDWNGDGTFDTDAGTLPTITHAFTDTGTHHVVLRVTDAAGAAGTRTVDVLVSNGLPIAAIHATPNPATAGDTVTLDASGSTDSDGTIVKYEWDFDGNGSWDQTTTSPQVTHRYPNEGVIPVAVRVTDDGGGTGTHSTSLTIQAPAGTGGGNTGGGNTGGGNTGGGNTGGGNTGGGNTGGGNTGGGRFVATLTGTPIQRLRTVLRRGIVLTCAANRSGTCRVTVQLSVRDAKKLHLARARARKPVTIGTALVLMKGRPAKVTLHLTKAARRALTRAKKMRTLKLLARGTVSDTARHAIPVQRLVLLRR